MRLINCSNPRQIERFLKILPYFYGSTFGLLLIFLGAIYWQTWGDYIKSRAMNWETYSAKVIQKQGPYLEVEFTRNAQIQRELVNADRPLSVGYINDDHALVALNPYDGLLVYIGHRPSDRGAVIFGLALLATAIAWALILGLFYLGTRAFASSMMNALKRRENELQKSQ